MSADATTAYFDDVIARAATAAVMPREVWPEAKPNKCHQNCEAYVARFIGFEAVRGWLVMSGHFCIPHSVIRDKMTGALIDITPEPKFSNVEPVSAQFEPSLRRIDTGIENCRAETRAQRIRPTKLKARRVLSENSIRLGIRIARQNHRMIAADARSPALARNAHHRFVQVAAPA